ncbi:hypothetical protein KRP22_004242 [Phytophthora ramorum]|nr:ABC transporter C family member 12 [Phytophthora ramorum]
MDHWPEIKQDYVKAPPTPDAVSLRESTTKPEAALFSLQPNPLERASLVSTVLAQWVYPMISLGSKKVLEMEDMWPLCPRDSCQALEIRFRRVYEPEKSHIFGLSPVAMAFAVAFRGELTVVFAGCMLYVLALGMQSYVAQGLLEFLNDEDNIFHISSGYWLMAMMTGSSLVAVLSLNYVFFVSARIGVNMRSLTMSLIYDKALRLSSEARQEYTTGEVLTLMSVDTERVFHFVAHGPWLVMGPLGFAISIMLVGVLFDFYSSIAGAVVLIAVMVLSVQQGDRIARLQKQLLQVIDERVKVTSEALQGVRVMKFYAWEDSLAQRVNKLRVREVALLRKFHLYQVVNSVMLFVTPTYLSGVTLGLYVLTRNRITVVEAFTLIAMVNICRTALSQLPQAIGGYSKAKISFARIDEFLLADEIVAQSLQPPSSPARALVAGARGSTSKGCISVRDASFRWPDMAPTEGVLVVTSAIDEPKKTTESPVETKEETNDAVLAGKLVQSEDRVRGTVSTRVYKTYFDESGFNGIVVFVVLAIAYCIAQTSRTVVDWWPGHWARTLKQHMDDLTYSSTDLGMWYLGLIILCSVLTMMRALMMIEACVRTSQSLHDELFRRVLRAPITRYFDVTPMGRILNRFSNDLDQMDSILPQEYQVLFQNVSLALGSLVVSAFASYWIGISYIPIFFIFLWTGEHYKKTSCEVKRLEGVTRTPVYNLFGETLSGLATIRAFRMQSKFAARNREVVDTNSNLYLTYWCTSRWLATRLDLLSVVIIFIVTLYLVSTKGQVGAMTSGISLTYSLMLTSVVQWVMRAVDRTDNAMTSVERLLFFRQIESEDDSGSTVAQLLHAEYQSTGSTTASWPSRGTIRFDQLCLRYRPELPLVLKGVDMDVAAGEKVGICGRTGAGKSSLMVALFRICDFDSGRVLIDDVDISSISVRELRRSLAIIPQDPVLFSGPLRENLDPFHEYSDERLWAVLKQVHMADKLRRWGSGLDFEVAEGGDNLSVGQRQLLCIGRALLKDSQVVVLDEATANVDTATDALIQTTIQETFAAKTVLIIAHRINTILHCDKIAVLDAGRVAEFGCPSDLLAQPQSVFAALAKRSGTVVM